MAKTPFEQMCEWIETQWEAMPKEINEQKREIFLLKTAMENKDNEIRLLEFASNTEKDIHEAHAKKIADRLETAAFHLEEAIHVLRDKKVAYDGAAHSAKDPGSSIKN